MTSWILRVAELRIDEIEGDVPPADMQPDDLWTAEESALSVFQIRLDALNRVSPSQRIVMEVGDIFLTITKDGAAVEWIVKSDGTIERHPRFTHPALSQ